MILKIIGWFFSILFALSSLAYLINGDYFPALFVAGMAYFSNPKVMVMKKVRAWGIFGLFVAFVIAAPKQEPVEQSTVSTEQVSVIDKNVAKPLLDANKAEETEPKSKNSAWLALRKEKINKFFKNTDDDTRETLLSMNHDAFQFAVNQQEKLNKKEETKVKQQEKPPEKAKAERDVKKPLALLSAQTDSKQEPAAPAEEVEDSCKLRGKVIKIADGDTVTILDKDKAKHKIRLAGIDAPESKQPYGKSAKKYLSKMVGKKEICVEWYKHDKYKRKVGNLFVDDLDVNFEMVKAGYAWHYKKFQKEQSEEDQKRYAEEETKAKLAVIGLWSEPDPIAPWDWRDGVRPKKKEEEKPKPKVKKASSEFSCGGKRFCKHMNSCAEARFYLNECGLGRLDRDKDGIPCEKLCGG